MEIPARVAAGEYVIKVKADTSEAEAAMAAIKPSDYGIRLAALDRALSIHSWSGHGYIPSAGEVVTSAARFESYLRDGENPSK